MTSTPIKQRKGVAKSQAKFEPEAFRDALFKFLETVQPGDWEGYVSSLDKAGNTLDYRKYADQLFEVLILGGLLAPGGMIVDDVPSSPFAVFQAKSAAIEDVRPYVDVMEKMIRRFKFLQKTLEESTMQGIVQYVNRFEEEQRAKLAVFIGQAIATGLISASVLLPLQKDHMSKDDTALGFVTIVFRTYLADQTIEQLGSALRKGGVRDWLAFFPQTKRSQPDIIVRYFKSEEVNLPQVADYYMRRQTKELRDMTVNELAELVAAEGTPVSEMSALLERRNKELQLAPEDFITVAWDGIIRGIDSSVKADQLELAVPKEIERLASVLEPLATNARAQINLINTIQLHCYTDTRVFKSFAHILKALYSGNVVSEQAIIYWAHKGAKPQGKQHFLKLAEPLVNFLESQDSDDEEE
ncbi:hypothetical protein MCUN1_003295 [Malassezia cuniculi]|uniref:W2 domain-containing protein n=1 Tax=Malassezia cuniculi TaxID=948313 RepID=A0AAF0EY50_9BASI|nr:hypothetical protein MCUN1_003295 [Malassezia cuniculi]